MKYKPHPLEKRVAERMGFKRSLRACYKGRPPCTGWELCNDKSCPEKHFFVWRYPNGSASSFLPDFKSDLGGLDSCFEWIEPFLREGFLIYHIGFAKIIGDGYACFMNRKAGAEYFFREEGQSKHLTTIGVGETLGLAFCDAAFKVLERYPQEPVKDPTSGLALEQIDSLLLRSEGGGQ